MSGQGSDVRLTATTVSDDQSRSSDGPALLHEHPGPGEVLVSSTVKDLVAGSGITFTDRESHVLKGVPGEWRLFAVASP